MTDLPREVRRVINARADDAFRGIFDAVESEDREALFRACSELACVLEDEKALGAEHDPDYRDWLEPDEAA